MITWFVGSIRNRVQSVFLLFLRPVAVIDKFVTKNALLVSKRSSCHNEVNRSRVFTHKPTTTDLCISGKEDRTAKLRHIRFGGLTHVTLKLQEVFSPFLSNLLKCYENFEIYIFKLGSVSFSFYQSGDNLTFVR